MSLADQGQRWYPTSVQVTVHQARSLRVKGKNGTNDSYAIIQLAKDKFSTSVAEKSVAPVWKEEASFDLPLFHPGNADRCTLHIIVMHRAQVGLDKFLGQAVVNLLELYDSKARKKTDWYKLVDKTGKDDKPRGEVLLDIQFMRNNMSASMFDLSMQDKPRSRISKLKDKVRGKKKDGFSDSASAIVPSVSQVLTDSEEEADAQSLNQATGVKKKSKIKTLFAPKSNLQRNISQSMSTLGTLPEKNSSLSSSRSSGLNLDSPEVKKKLKILGHRRTGSSDSKVSQGPFSLLGRFKQSNSELNNLCINGSHVYTEEESKTGSTISLNSSGEGSLEDVRKPTSDADTCKTFPSIQTGSERPMLEQQCHQEEEQRRQAEEKRIAEARRLKEEEERRHKEVQEMKRLLEDEERRKKQSEEEEEKRKREEERRMLEATENQRLEEERRRVEEQKRQEEASMSERLTSLFGIIRKKEEKKEEMHQCAKNEPHTQAPSSDSQDHNQPISSNPFEDIPLNSDPPLSSKDPQKSSLNPQMPSAMVFLNRTARVSAVKPRLVQSLEFKPIDCQPPSQLCPSPDTSESPLSSVPSESPDTFSSLHLSLAPRRTVKSPPGSPRGNIEHLPSSESSATMADKKRALLPPSYPVHDTQNGGLHVPVREINNPAYVEVDGLHQDKKITVPLPDYETLFPQKRHGVQGHTRWDHIIAEVNQKHRDTPPEFLSQEMSVDGPEENGPRIRSSLQQENPALRHYQSQLQEPKPMSSKKVIPPAPPKSVAPPYPRSVADSSQRKSQNITHLSPMGPNPSAVPGPANTYTSSRESLQLSSRDEPRKVLQQSAAPRPASQIDWDITRAEDQRNAQVTLNKEAPRAKPRQKLSVIDPVQQEDSAVTPAVSLNDNNRTLSNSSMSSMDKNSSWTPENFAVFDPFPSTDLLSKDPWTHLKQNKDEVDDLFMGNVQKEQKPEDLGMTADDLNNIFNQDTAANPFAIFNSTDSNKQDEYRENEESRQVSPAFQKTTQNQFLPSTAQSANKTFKSQQTPANNKETTITTANEGLSAKNVKNESVTQRLYSDMKTPSPLNGEEDPFGTEPFTSIPAWNPSEPLPVVMEEPEGQGESLPGGKTPLRAWVSPSEVQPASAQSSSGGGLAFVPRRPHPVKPMSSIEHQYPMSTPATKEIKVRDSTRAKIKVADSVQSGPYTQLTQEELITLVVKQQTDLSRKDAKIVELEEYIDNLLVRVIEEQPSILQSLKSTKPV